MVSPLAEAKVLPSGLSQPASDIVVAPREEAKNMRVEVVFGSNCREGVCGANKVSSSQPVST